MDISPHYSIQALDRILYVEITGTFDMHTTILCFYKIYKGVQDIQNTRWGLFIDMRGWRMTEQSFKAGNAVELHLDRRNQVCECWFVDHPGQGNHMVHYPKLAGIPLLRTESTAAAREWFDSHHLDASKALQHVQLDAGI